MTKLILATLCFACLGFGGYLLRDIEVTQVIGAGLLACAITLGIMSNET
jgi:hypothetical protein